MTDNLFFCPDIREVPLLTDQEAWHCVKVLRKEAGDHINVTDGKGLLFDCTISQISSKGCLLKINGSQELSKSWKFHLHIAFAPTKNMDRNEWFVEKATEIGTDRFSPLLCRFSERKEIKIERLEKIIISAMKQSHQAVMPNIDTLTPFEQFIQQPFAGRKFIAHCYPSEKTPLAQTYRKGENALILIGPEGDFSEEEVQHAIDLGFEPISLGENRLRTETACLVAVHTIHVINNI